MYNLLAITPALDSFMESYVTNQLNEIQEKFPMLAITHTDETSELYNKYIRTYNRFPAFIVFERTVYKEEFIGKIQTDQLLNWLNKLLV